MTTNTWRPLSVQNSTVIKRDAVAPYQKLSKTGQVKKRPY